MTAYFGLLDVGQPRPGDTVVVSTAAGAVGSAVGQIAKLMGCRAVGLTGGPIKSKLCREEFGYDDVIDYKIGAVSDALVRACPRGVDVYFDNTAGPITDAVLPQLAMGARVVICGTASVPSWDPPPTGPRVERYLLVKRARMAGLLIFDYQHRYEEAGGATGRVGSGWPLFVTGKTSATGSKTVQAQSLNFIEEKTSVSGLFAFATTRAW